METRSHRGGVINVSSVQAYMPSCAASIYGSTKAFNKSLSTGVAGETRNVDFMALLPMGVQTQMLKMRAGRNSVITHHECA